MSASLFTSPIPQLSVEALATRLAATPQPQLIDVREPDELAIVSLPNFVNLPLSQFAVWSNQIASRFDPHAETIVLCHHGVRSAQMCAWLMQQGFTDVHNVAGGIEAYAIGVDPSLARY